jgi:hypothetical protein
MPSSTARGFPYPLGTDPLSQGDDAIHSLASYLDANVPKYGDATDPNYCRVYRSLTTSVPNAGTATMTWDQESWNPTGMHSLGTAPTRITIGVAGKYLIVASVGFASNATGYRSVVVLLNGTTALQRSTSQAASGASHVQPCSVEAQLAVGDYIEITAGQNSGAALNTNGGTDQTSLSVRRFAA